MARGGFYRADEKVGVHEGGYVNHPSDPGGATNEGVIQRVYDSYRRSKGLPTQSVRNLAEVERLDIYRTRYWNVISGDKLPAGVDYVVYDGAVNSGPPQSAKWLQRALGAEYTGRIDGQIGPETLRAVEAFANHDVLIRGITDRRLNFLKALRTWKTFGKGWSRRVADVRATGMAWARGDTGPQINFIPGAEAKANVEDAKPLPGKGVADAATGGGLATGGLGGVLQQAQEKLGQFTGLSSWIDTLIVGLIIAGLVLTVGGFAYRWWADRKKSEIVDALSGEGLKI